MLEFLFPKLSPRIRKLLGKELNVLRIFPATQLQASRTLPAGLASSCQRMGDLGRGAGSPGLLSRWLGPRAIGWLDKLQWAVRG